MATAIAINTIELITHSNTFANRFAALFDLFFHTYHLFSSILS